MGKWVSMIVLLGCLAFLSCNDKKTDVDLFDEGAVTISLSADKLRGFEPMEVSFAAYLENRERQITAEISEAKWIIQGPNNFRREIIHDSFNYQDQSENKEDSFYLDFLFRNFGNYQIKLILNDGQYASNKLRIKVMQNPSKRGIRMP